MASIIGQEDSRKHARLLARIIFLGFLLTLVDLIVYDIPTLVFTWGEFLSTMLLLFIGFGWGVSYVHGWPKQASEDFDLVPTIDYGEE